MEIMNFSVITGLISSRYQKLCGDIDGYDAESM